MTRLSWLCGSIVAVVACSSSSGSGVTGTKKLTELSPDETQKLCVFSVDAEGGPRTVDCGNNASVTIHDQARCSTEFGALKDTCQVTVSDAEHCFEAFGDDPCGLGGDACAAFLDCVLILQPGAAR